MKKQFTGVFIASFFILAVLSLIAVGCGDDDDDDNDDSQTDDDDDDNDNDDDDTPAPPDNFSCEDLELPVREFVDAQSSNDLYAEAADFTLQTQKGAWNFKANFTGCENYLFIQDTPRQCSGWPIALWDRDVDFLLMRLPKNTHLFFMSNSTEQAEIDVALATIKANVDAALQSATEDEIAHWYHHIHYVTEPAKMIEGWLGELMNDPRWGVGIDSLQRIRYIGSYADYSRYDSAKGWFAPNLGMAANEAIYYNFEARRQTALDAQDASVLDLFTGDLVSDPGWEGNRAYVDVDFPTEAEMAQFDTLELDLYLGCEGQGEYGTCPAWDYLVYLYLCDELEPETCDVEVGRWITTYHREGRWVHDISALLPYLEQGGTRRLAFYTQQPYDVYLSARLYNQEKDARPNESTFLFSGGAFDENYNVDRVPVDLDIPANATKVELAVVISGHGQVFPGNCAEFCNTTHTFVVNGQENVVSFPQAGTNQDCMDQATNGTVPNQYGTWWFGRSGWCPGKEVPMEIIDITDQVDLGEENTFEYFGLYQDETYTAGGANIILSSWLVISK